MKKKAKIWFLTIFSTFLIAFSLIVLAYSINTDSLNKNLIESAETLRKECQYYFVKPDIYVSILDNYTDSIMLFMAGYTGEESAIEKSMKNIALWKEGIHYPYDQMMHIEDDLPNFKYEYPRYWHGYLVFLRPLLSIFNYFEIRILNAIMQFVMLITLVCLMIKNKLHRYILPFISVYLIMQPVSISMSLQNSSIWYITCISVIIYLLKKEKIIECKSHYLIFTVVGMITSFMDLLTYPIVPLGTLLVFVLISENLNFKDAIKKIISLSIFYFLGYAIMWSSKWFLATIITNKNILKNAFNQILFRTWQQTDKNILSNGVEKIIGVLLNRETLVVLIINMIVIINIYSKNIIEKVKTQNNFLQGISIWIVGLLTPLWYVVVANHTFVHPFLAFRTAFVFLFAILVGTYKMLEKSE